MKLAPQTALPPNSCSLVSRSPSLTCPTLMEMSAYLVSRANSGVNNIYVSSPASTDVVNVISLTRLSVRNTSQAPGGVCLGHQGPGLNRAGYGLDRNDGILLDKVDLDLLAHDRLRQQVVLLRGS
jgi:hypothetical protein